MAAHTVYELSTVGRRPGQQTISADRQLIIAADPRLLVAEGRKDSRHLNSSIGDDIDSEVVKAWLEQSVILARE